MSANDMTPMLTMLTNSDSKKISRGSSGVLNLAASSKLNKMKSPRS